MLVVFLGLLILLAVWVALPLLPAILIYRLFPDAPLVLTGPLAGLTVKTGGAFAAYLIIFLLIKSQVETTKDFVGSAMRSYWQVTAEASLTDETGKKIQVGDSVLDEIRAHPSAVTHDGTTLSFKIPEERMGHLPRVVEIYFPPDSGWSSDNLSLDELSPWWMFWKSSDRKVDPFFKTIDYGKVELHRQTRTQTSNSTLGMEKAAVVR